MNKLNQKGFIDTAGVLLLMLIVAISTSIMFGNDNKNIRSFHTKTIEELKIEKTNCEVNLPRNKVCKLNYNWVIEDVNNKLDK